MESAKINVSQLKREVVEIDLNKQYHNCLRSFTQVSNLLCSGEMIANIAEEDAKLDAMQRIWQTRRGLSSSLFDEVPETEDILSLNQTRQCNNVVNPVVYSCSEIEKNDLLEVNEDIKEILPVSVKTQRPPYLILDASKLGDLPARYTICAIDQHQFPVVGVYSDPRVIPGFKYRVRPLPKIGKDPNVNKCLFDNRALKLISIGRGYARSDNRPEGYAFELEVVSEGDKFTIIDLNGEAQGTLEILQTEGNQIEISNTVTGKSIDKRVQVKFIGKVEFYETGVAKPIPLTGTVMCVRVKGKVVQRL
ncbi:hypothetical protein HHI36_020724 [Cryptolaemus montrouzieri]|uniref:Uncharacterized protein n=1 Tax=Cryptolaemus montrouzieri TaxID=559131 RepID=A0ABD2NBK7_9CUCU